MKTRNILATFVILLFATLLNAQVGENMNVIMVGIGEKNPTFNEQDYPHLQFYYTPQLVSQAELGEGGKAAVSLLGGVSREVFAGAPELLAKWWDDKDLRKYALFFDKNGVGVWQGYLSMSDEIVGSVGEGEEEDLEDALELVVEDDETVEFDADKEFDYEDDDCVYETKLPDFNVVGVDGAVKSIKTLVESGKPTMVVFFQISSGIDLNSLKETKEEDSSFGGFMSSFTQAAAGSNYKDLFWHLEYYLYDYEVPRD